ncbi:MAG: SDR family oxidoreductase [Pseudomonadota bacterium]
MPLALVTGAAKRLGRRTSLTLAARGYDIAAHYNSSDDEARALAAEVEGLGRRCGIFGADLSDAGATAALFDEVVAAMGAPEVLINNASVFVNDDATTFDPKDLAANVAVNLTAPLILASRFAAAATPGANNVVVNMLDNKLTRMNPDFFSYTISKCGLSGATEMMAIRFAPEVRVVGVAPSVTLISGKQTQEAFERSQKMTLLGRGPTPEDIAATIMYLVDTKVVTGQTIVVDAGQVRMNLPRDVAFLVKDEFK